MKNLPIFRTGLLAGAFFKKKLSLSFNLRTFFLVCPKKVLYLQTENQ